MSTSHCIYSGMSYSLTAQARSAFIKSARKFPLSPVTVFPAVNPVPNDSVQHRYVSVCIGLRTMHFVTTTDKALIKSFPTHQIKSVAFNPTTVTIKVGLFGSTL